MRNRPLSTSTSRAAVDAATVLPATAEVDSASGPEPTTPTTPTTPTVAATGRSAYREDQVVELLVASNPKRAGGASRERFSLYYNGITVGEYTRACVVLEGRTAKKAFRYLSDIAWDLRHGFIRLHDTIPLSGIEEPAEEDAFARGLEAAQQS